MKSLLLLGAGSSIPAGIPSSEDLTWDAIRRLDTPYRLFAEYIYSLIQLKRSEQSVYGHTLNRPIYIETLINSILPFRSTLSNSDTFALVKDWHILPSGLLEYDKRYREHKGLDPSEPSLGFYVDWTPLQLKHQVLNVINNTPQGSVYYLNKAAKLCASGDLLVTTLNYDCVFERAARQAGVIENIDSGIAPAKGCQGRLIKLHGSVNWSVQDENVIAPDEFDDIKELSLFEVEQTFLLGGINKLSYTYPFFDLYVEFRERIKQVQKIIVSGYSFSDAHVNYIIKAWLHDAAEARKQLIIIDPSDLDPNKMPELEMVMNDFEYSNITDYEETSDFGFVMEIGNVIHISEKIEKVLDAVIDKYL